MTPNLSVRFHASARGAATPNVRLVVALILWLAMVAFSNSAYAATPPTITSFSPTVGLVGSSITITGSNFDPTPTENIVYFGAVRAMVTAATSTSLTVTVPVSAIYGPVSVTVGNASSSSSLPFNALGTSARLFQADSFVTPPFGLAGDGAVYSQAVADFDGDGKPDLALANFAGGSVSFFRNISASGLLVRASFSDRIDVSVGPLPTVMVAVDLDQDGKLDLAVPNLQANTVTILRNTSVPGTLSFASAINTPSGSAPSGSGSTSLAAGDLDGDGKPDLAVGNESDRTVSLLRNQSVPGTITFTSQQITFHGSPRWVAIGDLDGDRKLDLGVAGYGTGAGDTVVALYRNDATPGMLNASSFSTRANLTTGNYNECMALGDLDGDGKLDLVVTHNGGAAVNSGNVVTVFRNQGSPGSLADESFSRFDFTAGSGVKGAAIGDLDNDGRPDLVVGCYQAGVVSVLRNTIPPGGAVTAASFTSRYDVISASSPYYPSIVDLDGDGLNDIVVYSYDLGVLWVSRNQATSFPPRVDSLSATSGFIGSRVTINGTNFSATPSENIVYFGGVRGSVITAAANSLIVSVPIGATYSPISVTVNGLTAYSQAAFIPKFPGSTGISIGAFQGLITFGSNSPTEVAAGDLDGDGKLDLVVVESPANSGGLRLYRNVHISGPLSASSFVGLDLATAVRPSDVTISDLDGDGKLDLAVVHLHDINQPKPVSLFRNISTPGNLIFQAGTAVDSFVSHSVSATDLDGDGKPEIIVGNVYGNEVSILRNISSVGRVSFAAKRSFPSASGNEGLAVTDLDLDGKADIIVGNTGGNLSILRNNSTIGNLQFDEAIGGPLDLGGALPYDVAAGDLDADGKPDLIAPNAVGSTFSLFRNTSSPGQISFTSGRVPIVSLNAVRSVTLGDINGDGKVDLVVGGDGTISVFQNRAAIGALTADSFEPRVDLPGGLGQLLVPTVADLNNDTRPDLVTPSYPAGSWYLLENTIPLVSPNITSFSPGSGSVGSSITINGANFSATSSENIVYFGAAQAIVTWASATTLTVIVPAGATDAPVSVTVHGIRTVSEAFFYPETGASLNDHFRPGNLPAGLVGYWKLDEVSGPRLDSSSRPNHLADNNGTTSATGDYWGSDDRPAQFRSSENQYLWISNEQQSGLNISNRFTLSCWVKVRNSGDYKTLFSKFDHTANQKGFRLIIRPDGMIELQISSTGSDQFEIQPASLTSGRWHHLAVAYDQTNLSTFVDGNLVHTTPFTQSIFNSNAPFQLGATFCNSTPCYFYDGLMKDAAVWTTNLTSLQIKSLALGVDLSERAVRPDSLANGLVSYWKLNEIGNGGAPTLRVDSGPGRNDLADLSAVAGDTGGFIEGVGARFVGEPHDGPMGDYLKRANGQLSSSLKWDSVSQSFTVAVWSLSTGGDSQDVICSLHLQGVGYRGFRLGSLGSLESASFLVNRSGGATDVQAPTRSVRRNTWHHLVGVYDSAAGQVRLYVDGVLRASAAHTAGVGPADGDLLIGTNGENVGADFYSGRLSDLAIWNRALSQTEIASLATGLPMQTAGFVSYWNLDEESGPRLDSFGTNDLANFNGVIGAEGIVGRSADFINANAYLSIMNVEESSLNFHGDMTLIGWVNARSASTQALLDKASHGPGYGLNISAAGSYVMNVAGQTADSGVSATPGSWQHVTGIRNGSTDSMWIDSTLRVNESHPLNATDLIGSFNLGTQSAFPDRPFNGLLDEFLVARRALRPEEVKAIYNLGLNGMPVPRLPDATAGIEIFPAELVFGRVPIGSSVILSFTIINHGANSVETAATLLPPFQVIGPATFSVPGLSSREILIRFAPETETPVTNTFGLVGGPTALATGAGSGDALADADGDGIPDFWEQLYGLNPNNAADANGDFDNDGLSNSQEFQFHTRPDHGDTDGDGLGDHAERFIHHTNPQLWDSDGDGMDDAWELANGLNPLRPNGDGDFDSDGVNDIVEYRNGLDPRRYSSFDGVSDYQRLFGEERNRFTYDRNDRLVGAEYGNGLVIGYLYDGNGNILRQAYLEENEIADGLSLLWRFLSGLSITNSPGVNGAYDDPDHDGWTNLQEWQTKTSPTDANSSPALLGLSSLNLGSLDLPFTPSRFHAIAGVLDMDGVDTVVIAADGNPGATTNAVLILSQANAGWRTERLNIGSFGVTSMIIGQVSSRTQPSIYLALRETGGAGVISELMRNENGWTNVVITNSTTAAYVLGVGSGGELLVSLAQASIAAGTVSSLVSGDGGWQLSSVNPNLSNRSLGTVVLSQDGRPLTLRLLDSGQIEIGSVVPTMFPALSTDLVWSGLSLAMGPLGSESSPSTSLVYAFINDINASGRADAGDEFIISRFNPATPTEAAIRSTNHLSFANSSYGLAITSLGTSNNVLFTADPDGLIQYWAGGGNDGPFTSHLFSSELVGQAPHVLTQVKTFDREGLLAVVVQPQAGNTGHVHFWPPHLELPNFPDAPQTAPLARILPTPEGASLVTIPIRLWDAEGNTCLPSLQFQLPGNAEWIDAIVSPSSPLRALPTGATYTLAWGAGAVFSPGTATDILLRVRARDVTLTGDWSETVSFRINIPSADDDGLPDDWENQYFGDLLQTPAGDFDGDGFPNFSEYLAGTDPTNPASNLELWLTVQETTIRLQWIGNPIVVFYVEYRPDLSPASRWEIIATNPMNPLDVNRFGGGGYYRIRLGQ